MKGLYLYFSRLRQYCRKAPAVFALFLVGAVLNSLILTYCYGNLVPSIALRNAGGLYRRYDVYMEPGYTSIEHVRQTAADPLLNGYVVSAGENTYSATIPHDYTLLEGTLEFTDPLQVLVPARSKRPIGSSILLYGNTFEVIGVVASDSFYVPEEAFFVCGMDDKITTALFYSVENHPVGNDPVTAMLRDRYSDARHVGGIYDTEKIVNAKTSKTELFTIGAQAFASVLTYSFLLQYMLRSLRKENVVGMLLGASKLRTGALVMADALSLSWGSSILGLALHRLLYTPLFTKLNLYTHIQYTISDYSLILFILLALALVTSIPVVLSEVLSTPAAARRRNLC